jgi:hypothetical protein
MRFAAESIRLRMRRIAGLVAIPLRLLDFLEVE